MAGLLYTLITYQVAYSNSYTYPILLSLNRCSYSHLQSRRLEIFMAEHSLSTFFLYFQSSQFRTRMQNPIPVRPQATQAQAVSDDHLVDSDHGENIRVCMGIFTIGFRK